MRFLFLLLAFPLFTFAENDFDLKQQKEFLKKAIEASALAEDEMPPCEGLDHFSETFLRHEPPKACPNARLVFERLTQMDRKLRDHCRDFTRWTEDTLEQNEAKCESPRGEKQFAQIRRELQARSKDPYREENDAGVTAAEAMDELFDDAEFKRPECEFWISVAMQFRKKEMSFAARHVARANEAIYGICDKRETEAYRNFLRYGEDGN